MKKLPIDILDKINQDLSKPDDRELIIFLLENLNVNERHRIMRCILFLAQGDMDIFGEYEKLAKIDYRDVIMNAEYEYPSEKRLRDFSKPFKEETT
ncbi:MAG: hypothetical protein GY797_40565 [Deltaproteobacteria bacterium]|nr:hypothetical protein [Deltaproteobacteria bacterium]